MHGFFAIMGGLAVRLPAKLESKVCFLNEHSMSMISNAHSRILGGLSEEDIKSRTKADGIAKTAVLFQALWFIAQCITRLAQRIPISLLELNTWGHAICALFFYVIWWDKPYDVEHPIMLERAEGLCHDLDQIRSMASQSRTTKDLQLAWRSALQQLTEFHPLPQVRSQSYLWARQRRVKPASFHF